MAKMNNLMKHKVEKEELVFREKALIRLIIKAVQKKKEKLTEAGL